MTLEGAKRTVWRGTAATAEVQYDYKTAVFGICSEENINVAGRVPLWQYISGVFDKIAMTRCGNNNHVLNAVRLANNLLLCGRAGSNEKAWLSLKLSSWQCSEVMFELFFKVALKS
ncbi:hypothetical protein L195_g037107, partial [Trifolium pratense]